MEIKKMIIMKSTEKNEEWDRMKLDASNLIGEIISILNSKNIDNGTLILTATHLLAKIMYAVGSTSKDREIIFKKVEYFATKGY